jgi:hypothetical protein
VSLPELDELDALVADFGLATETLVEVDARGARLPVVAVELGAARGAPTLVLTGGIHGRERIGCGLVLSTLRTLAELASWDEATAALLEQVRVVAVPVVNPGGVLLRWRSNPNGVDLMRNAPVEATGPVPPLLSGHRVGPWLPWYRGEAGVLEPEVEALLAWLDRELEPAPVALSLDVHSGFGVVDRLWYPYAKQAGGFPAEGRARAFGALLDRTLPDHPYRLEPQADAYGTHGDLWDLVFDRKAAQGGVYVPWTLEMGSWRWTRARPWQLLHPLGLFDPIAPALRRQVRGQHRGLMDVLLRALLAPDAWTD